MSRLAFRFFLILLLLTSFGFKTKAEIFMVTSNADAGVGTLREALTKAAANGSAEKDFIHFNLPDQSEAGRTITLLSQLPDVSSNLDIDGSTQVGSVFGVSTAKIRLVIAFPLQGTMYGLKFHDVEKIGVFGIYLSNLKKINIGENNEEVQGISLLRVKDINLGDIGKGLVVCGFYNDIGINVPFFNQGARFLENLSIKASFFGVEPDGITLSGVYGREIMVRSVHGIIDIGDGTDNGRNVFAKGFFVHQDNSGSFNTSKPAYFNIKNNIFGNNLMLNLPDELIAQYGIYFSTVVPDGLNYAEIEGNVISSKGIGIFVTNIGKSVNIKRNYIGIDKTLSRKLLVSTGITVSWSTQVTIGSNTNSNDANYIAYTKPVRIHGYSSVAVYKNSFFCTVNSYPMINDSNNTRTYPKVEITSATANSVTGTATPNSQIELFYSDLCGTCSPETYFATTTADASGNWIYNGTILRSVVASATLNGITSEFTRTRVDISGVRVVNTCANTGSIIGALPLSASYVEWLDVDGNVVGIGRDLLNVPTGFYRLKAVNGDCSEVTPWFEIKKGLSINASNIQVSNPACGLGGGIRGVQVVNNISSLAVFSWKNEIGTEVGTTQNLLNVPAGKYTLTVRTADNSCIETYGPVTLSNASGPNISLSSLVITAANCGANTGAITGITATGSGTITYRWKNANNVQVANTKDLINQPPGRYTLEITDQSSCGIVSTSPITILEGNGITINDSQKQVFNPTCVGNNGSIKGLQVTGATSYNWKNSNGQTVGVQADLEGMVPGNYQLTASNSFCSKTYDLTLAAQPNLISFQGTSKAITDASCGLNNGKLIVTLQNVVRLPKSYRWEDKAGRTVGRNTNVLENVDAGEYSIYGIDDNDCEIYLASYSIGRQPLLTFRASNYRITHDNCNQRQGSITGLQITGGVGPFTYKWTNEAGVQVGSNLDVANLPQGRYTLSITDALNCTPLVASYSINNQLQQIAVPNAIPVQLCAPGEAMLRVGTVGNPMAYALYATENSFNPLEVSSNGVFKVNVSSNNSYYITQRIGDCESAKVEVTVGLSGLTIPNTITPNNDGINDVWNLKGIENYPKANIQIFSRSGSKIYESIGYKIPFDGTNKGISIPVGVYYYVIKLGTECELITGNLTIVR